MKLDKLMSFGIDDTGDEPLITVDNVLTVVEVIEELKSSDILYKLSAISGDALQQLARKAASIKLLEIEDAAIDDYFNEEEKGFVYGCFLMSTQPVDSKEGVEQPERRREERDDS